GPGAGDPPQVRGSPLETGCAADPPRHARPLGGPLAGGGAAPEPGHLGGLRPRALRPARLDPSGRAAAALPSGGDPQVPPCTPDREAPAGQSPDRPIPSRRARDNPPRAGSPAMAGAGIRVPAAPHRLAGDSPAELPLRRAEPSRADLMNDFTLFLGKFLTQ